MSDYATTTGLFCSLKFVQTKSEEREGIDEYGGDTRPCRHCESFGPATSRTSIQSGPAEELWELPHHSCELPLGFSLNSVLGSALLCIVLLS